MPRNIKVAVAAYCSANPDAKIPANNRKQIDIRPVVTNTANFFRGNSLIRRARSSGGTLWPKRFNIGRHPLTQPAPEIVSTTAGMMILSVLKIQPVLITI